MKNILHQCPKCHRRGFQPTSTCPNCSAECVLINGKRGFPIKRGVPKPERKKSVRKPVDKKAFVKYADYLKSSWWKKRRKKKIKSVGFKCEECPDRARQVHHLHYKSLWNESDQDLQALCGACHKHKHQAIIDMEAHLDAIVGRSVRC